MNSRAVNTPEQARQVVRRWILGLRVTLALIAVISLGIWIAHQSGRPTAQVCQSIQQITGSPGSGCGSDTAINGVGIAGLVFAVLFALSLTMLRLPRPPVPRKTT